MKDTKKILLVGDYSNFHATLAKGLQRIGCDVTVASNGGHYVQCARDIDISRRFKSKAGGGLHAAWLYGIVRKNAPKYDIISLRDPLFFDLKPGRVKWFFDLIRKLNPNVFSSYITTDVPFLDMLEAKDSPLKYSEFFIDGKPNRLLNADKATWDQWHAPEMKALNEHFYRNVKGVVTSLYEYHMAAQRVVPAERLIYGGLPIDTASIEFKEIDKPHKVRIFLARDKRRQLQKGSDYLEIAARNVVARHGDKAEFILVENVPRKQYMEIMQTCHLMLDQIYSYTPATMALEGMASGLSVVTGGEPDFYDFIGEKENRPVINAPIELEPLEKVIEETVLHPERFAERSRRGRQFVEKHNSAEVVARRYLDFWQSCSTFR